MLDRLWHPYLGLPRLDPGPLAPNSLMTLNSLRITKDSSRFVNGLQHPFCLNNNITRNTSFPATTNFTAVHLVRCLHWHSIITISSDGTE